MRPGVLLLFSAGWLAGSGMEPKEKPEDYPAHGSAAGAAIGAEFLGRYLPGDKTSHMTGNYVVVEIGFYPAVRGKLIRLGPADFRLRLNDKRDLVSQTPGIVAGALRNPHWQHEKGVTAVGGVGPAVVVIRPDRRQPRFPGDPEVREPGNTRDPPKVEDASAEKDAGDAAIRRALPDELVDRPAAGLLYFAWDEPIRKLKSIALVYDGPAGKLVLALK